MAHFSFKLCFRLFTDNSRLLKGVLVSFITGIKWGLDNLWMIDLSVAVWTAE